jgi:hypothetical protein
MNTFDIMNNNITPYIPEEYNTVLDKIDITNEYSDDLHIYKPVLQKVSTYGSVKHPLYCTTDIAKLFGKKDLHIRDKTTKQDADDDKGYIIGLHYVKRKVKIGNRSIIKNLLTTEGLIKASTESKHHVALKIQAFLAVVLDRLRLKGQVHIDDAVRDFQDRISMLSNTNKELKAMLTDTQKELERTEKDLEWEHEQLVREKVNNENMYQQKLCAESDADLMYYDRQNSSQHSIEYYELERQLNFMREKYMRPIYVKLMQPPAHLKEEYDYDASDEIPTRDDTYIFSVTTRLPKEKEEETKEKEFKVAKFYIHKEQKVEQVKKILEEYGTRVSRNIKNIYEKEKFMANRFQTSIDEINNIIKDFTQLPLEDKKINIDAKLKEEAKEEDIYQLE